MGDNISDHEGDDSSWTTEEMSHAGPDDEDEGSSDEEEGNVHESAVSHREVLARAAEARIARSNSYALQVRYNACGIAHHLRMTQDVFKWKPVLLKLAEIKISFSLSS